MIGFGRTWMKLIKHGSCNGPITQFFVPLNPLGYLRGLQGWGLGPETLDLRVWVLKLSNLHA